MATVITSVTELQAMEDDLDADYELGNNIDAAATSGWNGGEGFAPISEFTGNFDGRGYTINDLFINRPDDDYIGLFGEINNAATEIKNVGLVDVNITGDGDVGALVGLAYECGAIRNCYSTGSVTGNDDDVGGLIGYDISSGCVHSKCYSTATVSSVEWQVGGLIGVVWSNGTISNCYTRGSVTGDERVGGLVGDFDGAIIDDCYSTGAVSGNGQVGGFCGLNWGTITNCFWDTQTSGQATSDGGTRKTTAEMKIYITYGRADWDFTTIWSIATDVNNGYPALGQITSIGRRHWWVEDSAFHYFDQFGVERKAEGTTVTGVPSDSLLPIFH